MSYALRNGHDEIRDRIAKEAEALGLHALVEHRATTQSRTAHFRGGQADLILEGPERVPLEIVEVKTRLRVPSTWEATVRQLRRYQVLFGTQYSCCAVCPFVPVGASEYFLRAGFWVMTPDRYCGRRLHAFVNRFDPAKFEVAS